MKITKAKAIEILEELVSRIESVKQQPHVKSPEFIKWFCDTETAIKKLFPEDTTHLAKFKSIEYKVAFDTRSSQGVYETFFCNALLRARAVLQSMQPF